MLLFKQPKKYGLPLFLGPYLILPTCDFSILKIRNYLQKKYHS